MAPIRLALTFLMLLAWGGPSTVAAQDIRYQRLPIGDRAVGMGGAYTGVAEDLSATWYNPGGLAFQSNAAVSGAIFLRVYDRYHIGDGYGFGDQTTDLTAEGTLATPFFIGGMAKVGDEDDPGERRHAIAFTGVGPSLPTRRFDAFVDPEAGTAAGISIVTQESQELYGPTYAYRLSDDVGLGISGYVTVANRKYDESEFVSLYGSENPDGSFADTNLTTRISGGRAEVFSFLFRLGAFWQVKNDLSLGLMVQLPSLPFVRNSEVFEYTAAVTDDGTGRFVGNSQSTEASLPVPLEIRLGVAYSPRENWRLAFDFSFYSPLGSEENPISMFGDVVVDPETGTAPDVGRYLADGYYTRPWVNFALGMETIVADIMPVSFGIYTDLSPTPAINGPSDTLTPQHIDSVGLTGVVGIRTGGLNIAVGTAVVLGWGSMLVGNFSGAGPAYVPREINEQAVYIFLTGYMSAAEQLAQEIEDAGLDEAEIRERDAEQQRLEAAQAACEERLARELRRAAAAESEEDPDTADAPPSAPPDAE